MMLASQLKENCKLTMLSNPMVVIGTSTSCPCCPCTSGISNVRVWADKVIARHSIVVSMVKNLFIVVVIGNKFFWLF
jgi:hypothetical protein